MKIEERHKSSENTYRNIIERTDARGMGAFCEDSCLVYIFPIQHSIRNVARKHTSLVKQGIWVGMGDPVMKQGQVG